MTKTDIITMAAKNLMRRKARTFLTMLGVLIGTTAIVVMVSLGIGLQEAQQSMYEQWGSLNEITVNPSYSRPTEDGEEEQKIMPLNDEAVEYFKTLDGVSAVMPRVYLSGDATCGKMEGYLSLYGVDPALIEYANLNVDVGRTLEPGDRNVVVIGSMAGDNFWDPNDPSGGWNDEETYDEYLTRVYEEKTLPMLDKKVTVTIQSYSEDGETEKSKKLSLQVVGITEKGKGDAYSSYAPIDVVQKLQRQMLTNEERHDPNRNDYDSIAVITEDVSYTGTLMETLTAEGYNAYSIVDSLEGVEDSMLVVELALGGIGGITLLVAAIGIINTMVMSIYERTKEIAIMKVIGATFNDIRMMFLAEAGMIGLFGGTLGLILSYALSFVINQLTGGFMGDYMGTGEALSLSVIPWWLALFAILFSMLIGLLAGVYPANRAVRLSPIEAMRNN